MLLTVSKRLEFSASRRLHVPHWSEEENRAAFGEETTAGYGSGRNYVAYFVFSGTVDPTNGMLVNISEIKARIEQLLHARFDHKFLNEDHPAFEELPPTTENVARQLFVEVAPLFTDVSARLVACHLVESEERSATCYFDGAIDENHWLEFSAARQTISPHLSAAENEALFGVAASPHGHGHHYRARFTFHSEPGASAGLLVPNRELIACLGSLRAELDHRNLNYDVPDLSNRAITTESLGEYLFQRVAASLPLHRVRLHERDDFFAEYARDGRFALGMRRAFNAAHRLHSPTLSDEENLALYGKCNNPRGHGHTYLTEATIGGDYDERSGTLFSFSEFAKGMEAALQPWHNRHLDRETEEFRDQPSTGENIVRALWPKLNAQLDGRLVRLRLWETANNRFTLRV
jgi:6-pyruvoyltetrahydropterin/6-carboxytetrahydropterin synthase